MRRLMLALAVLVGLAVVPLDGRADAQVAGSVSGIVRPGPGADVSTAGVLVELVALGQGPTVLQETRTTAGRFRFEIERIDPKVAYLARAVVDGVHYLPASPVQLSASQPSAQLDIEIYGVTPDRPDLRSSISATTIVAVDREAGTLVLQREDAIVNPSKRAWAGDADGVTLRLPVVAGATATAIEGQAFYNGLPSAGGTAADGDGVAVKVPFRPGETMLITRFTVSADLVAPAFDLRTEAVLPTEQLQVMIPERFARRVQPVGDALAGTPITVEGQKLLVIERSRPAGPGDAVVASVVGLAAPIPPHPLTDLSGAGAGATVSALLLVLGAVFAVRRAEGSPRAVSTPAAARTSRRARRTSEEPVTSEGRVSS